MLTEKEIIQKAREIEPGYYALKDDEVLSAVLKKYPKLQYQKSKGALEVIGGVGKEIGQGIVDFSEAGVTGIDNLLTDITNLTVGKVTGKEYNPIREILVPTGEKYEGGLLRRTTGRLGEFGEQTWEGAKAEVRGEQTKAESVYQMGGEALKFATGTFGDIVGTGLSTIAPDKLETKVKDLVQEGLTETKSGQWITQKMTEFDENMKYLEKNDPEAYRNYRATFGYLGAGFEAVGLKKVSGIYKMGGKIKHLPIDKIKKLTQEATTKLEEAVLKTGEIIRTKKDNAFDKISETLGNLPTPSKEYQKAVSSIGTEFEVEKTPSLFENFNDQIFSRQNKEMAVQSVFPKQTKEKGISARLNAGETALKGIEQLYDDKARGIIKTNINEMGGGVEGIQQGLEYWGKKIGEYTDVDTTVNFTKEIDTLAKSLDEKFAKLNPEMYGRVKRIVDEFKGIGDEVTIKDLQKGLSNIKSDVFSDFKITKELASSSTGKALGNLLESLTDKFNATIDIATGNSKQLKEAKGKYSSYLKIQKDLTDSFIVAQRTAGKGLAGTAGKIGGVYELLNNPSLSGVLKGILLKQSGELISKAKSRAGNWEMLIRNLDRKAVRDYNLKKQYVQQSENLAENITANNNNLNLSDSRSDIDSALDSKKSLVNEAETLEFVQDIAKQIEESIGDTELLTEIKEAINDIEIPKKYKEILNEKVDAHIRDVENYKREVDTGKTPFDDDFGTVESIYGSDLTKAFNVLQGVKARTKTTKGGDKMTSIEFQKSPAYKTFSSHAEEYLGDNIDNLSVQEVFEKMEDFGAGAKFQTKAIPEKIIEGVDEGVEKLDEVNTQALKNLNYKGKAEDLSDKQFEKYINERDRILALEKPSKEFLRGGREELSTQGTNTEMLARERFKIPELKKLGAGSDRIVYELGDNKVVKIVKTARGFEQTAQGLDFYLQREGIIPEVFEYGKNYVVAERFRPFKELPKEDKKLLNDFIKDMGEIRTFADANDMGKVYERLEKYGWEALADFDLRKFGWNDINKANLNIKDGKPILIDEGTLNLSDTITSFEGKTNFDDPVFRAIVKESRELKKSFKDIDKNTMFQKTELVGQGEEISQVEGKKIVEKYFTSDEVGVEFVDNITTPEGLEALGKYREKLITFSKNPLESTPEHEVLHAFFDTMTTPERKIKVLDDIKVKEKFDNDLDAEEWLADNFVNFARNREVSGITDNVKQFFNDMLRGLKTIFFEGDVVENLYRDLENLTKQRGISKPKAVIIGGATKEEEE